MTNDPCLECIIQAACSEYCEEKVSYYAFVVYEFRRYGIQSMIYRNATKDVQHVVRAILELLKSDNSSVSIKKIDTSKMVYRLDQNGNSKLHENPKIIPSIAWTDVDL